MSGGALPVPFDDPTVVVPVLVLAGGVLAWAAYRRPEGEAGTVRRTPYRRGERDVMSRGYWALADDRYAPVLQDLERRLLRTIESVYAGAPRGMPWTRWGARRRGVPDPGPYRAALRRVGSLTSRARRSESLLWVRGDIWRTRRAALAYLRSRVAESIDRVEPLIAGSGVRA